ncbi:EMI domain-containing protein [Prochlorococcus marinus]|uniref:EMI domain-containing protein n=1 Tax=Prochlorococcus marinus TaxID=1219 RepID=UPI0007B37F6B|nr:EMI domain-containing protein [Prochlorococcus marinus]KZR77881.1 hypothetical protein PMIT1320_00268 [Prochlorococcus marinus str. MIT 1320]
MSELITLIIDRGDGVFKGDASPHNPHHPMNFKSALAATALAVISTTSAMAISTPAQAADGCGRGWRYSHSYRGCVLKRHLRPVYVPVSRRYPPIYRRSIYRPAYRNVYRPVYHPYHLHRRPGIGGVISIGF